jgi:DNA-binding MarR family transcriptional regulator
MARVKDIPLFERRVQAFLARHETEIDAQAAIFNLDYAAKDVIASFEAVVLRPNGLRYAGFVMLMSLWITGPRETRELAAILRVSKGAVVSVVNTLEGAGLVRRIRSEMDRRLITVELTDGGRDLVIIVQSEWHQLERAVTADLTTREMQTFAAICRKIAHAARALRRRQASSGPRLPDPAVFLVKQVESARRTSIAHIRKE